MPEVLAADAEPSCRSRSSPAAFQDLLVRGQAVVSVSGLDELPDQSSRAQAVKLIEAWMTEFPNCHYVVTCRSRMPPSLR